MSVIVVSGVLSATDSDVLANTRLQSLPGPGLVTVELQSSANDGTNGFTATLELPSGDTPMNSTAVPAGVTSGALNRDDKMNIAFRARQGGKVTLALTESGTAVCAYRVTWRGR